jgi:putative endonuclease
MNTGKLNPKIQVGRKGEEIAADYLAEKGVTIIARNQRTAYGEIDLVGFDRGALVFFEVRTKTNDQYGFPEDSITPRKRLHLINSAEAFVQAHSELSRNWRIDLIGIRLLHGQEPQVDWFENAVSY